MLTFPTIDPVAVALGPVKIHWYGIMYLLGFAAGWYIAVRRTNSKYSPVLKKQVEDLVLFGALGVVLGGRIGYVLFYHFDSFLADPVWLFKVWEGGMSFHGGFLGVVIAMWIYARRHAINFIDLLDFIAPSIPPGLGFGRLGNFIGQELWGRPSDVPWAMVFPKEGADAVARHPSQLYEAFFEGLVLFVVLYWFSLKPRPRGALCGLGILLYGVFRTGVEFTRQPDAHLSYDLFGWVTRGQILSIPMIVVGAGLMIWAYKDSLSSYSRHR